MVDAAIEVFTFRRGLLSRFGHDLRLALHGFTIELAATQVTASFDLRSLQVLGAVAEHGSAARALSASDKAQIERAMNQDVLRVRANPNARLEAELSRLSPARFRVSGSLTLHGISAVVQIDLDIAERARGAVQLAPTRWGIEPYSALGGGLKLADRVRVEVDLPTTVPGFDPEQWQTMRCTWRGPQR
jgi:hypothetical protein